MKLKIAHLYPRLMNIYGDRGNVLCLSRRCRDRDINVEVDELGPGDKLRAGKHDLIFMGGAQDREQQRVVEDLHATKGPALLEAAEAGTVILAVCGAYQIFGTRYVAASGEQLTGLGLFDCWTRHPGPADDRLIGNVIATLAGATEDDGPSAVGVRNPNLLVGFENHGGRTYLGKDARPLARVLSGYGNNGKDGTEGVRRNNAFGSYLHGSLLPKNPAFADLLIALALGVDELAPLDDEIENAAHRAALRLTGRRR